MEHNHDAVPKNWLLAALPQEHWEQMQYSFVELQIAKDELLIDADEPLKRLYFPTEGVISAVRLFENGAIAEIATTGPEGMVDVGVVLGSAVALARQVVQVSGNAFSLPVRTFVRLEQQYPSFHEAMLRYTQAYLLQVSQSAVCNAVHSAQQRAARWLLTCHDRSPADSFAITQELLSEMLGLSRPVVNAIARALKKSGSVQYERGLVTIIDRNALEKVSCECYRSVRQAYEARFHTRFAKTAS